MNTPQTGARILGRTGAAAGITHAVGETTTVGRSAENDIVINSPFLSGHHARIYAESGKHWIEDLGSRNGTRVDGVAVTRPVHLEGVHVITLADAIDLVYVRSPDATPAVDVADAAPGRAATHAEPHARPIAPATPTPGQAPAPRDSAAETRLGMSFDALVDPRSEAPAPAPASADPQSAATSDATQDPAPESPSPIQDDGTAGHADRTMFLQPGAEGFVDPRAAGEPREPAAPRLPRNELVLTMPSGESRTYTLKIGRNVLGRAEDCDVTVPDPERWLSRHHATLTVSPDRVTLTDQNTVNGTFVGDVRIESMDIEPGTTFRLGPHAELTLHRQ